MTREIKAALTEQVGHRASLGEQISVSTLLMSTFPGSQTRKCVFHGYFTVPTPSPASPRTGGRWNTWEAGTINRNWKFLPHPTTHFTAHRMIWVEKDIKDHIFPTLLHLTTFVKLILGGTKPLLLPDLGKPKSSSSPSSTQKLDYSPLGDY